MSPTDPSCFSTNSASGASGAGHPGRRGSAMVVIIMTILLMGILGAGMSRLFSSGAVETAVSVPAPNVQYVTETGFRLVAAEFNDAAESDREDVLEDMHGKTFVLDSGSGSQVTVNIASYWFRITSVSGNVLTVESLSQIPLQDMDTPGGALIDVASAPKISINRSLPLTVTGISLDTTGSQHTATITLSSTPPLAESGDSVYLVQDSGNGVSVSGDDLLGLPSDFAFFPSEKGQFYLYDGNDTVYEYQSMDTNSDGTVNLRGVTNLSGKASSDFRGQDFILLKTVAMSCTGAYGTGTMSASQTETTYSRLGGDGVEEVQETLPTFIMDSGFASLEDWEENDNVAVTPYTSAQGDHVFYAAMSSPDQVWDSENGEYIKVVQMCLDKHDQFANAWTNSTNSLSYDIQVKLGSGWLMLYGAMGVSFKHHQATSGQDEFYGVSVMKYYNWAGGGGGHGHGHGGGGGTNTGYSDYIPDGIKPAGMGSDVSQWRWERLPSTYSSYQAYMPCECSGNCNDCEARDQPLTQSSRTDKILIVLWKQYVSGGSLHRAWMAYKDISDDYYASGKQWWADGRIVNDNFSLFVRCEERVVDGEKTNFIKVFYGDASDEYPTSGPRTTNSVSYDIRNLRGKYIPAWDTGGGMFPAWPPFDTDSWNATVDDMSYIRKAPDSYVATRGKACTWDGVNSAVSSKFTIMWDGGTIRSKEFLTPDDIYPATRREVCLHAYYDPNFDGGLDYDNEAATFDDFQLRAYHY